MPTDVMKTNVMQTDVMRTRATRSTDNVYYLPRRSRHAALMARIARQRGYECLKAGFYVTGGTLIGFALANLPALFAATLNVLPLHPM